MRLMRRTPEVMEHAEKTVVLRVYPLWSIGACTPRDGARVDDDAARAMMSRGGRPDGHCDESIGQFWAR